MSFNTYYQNKKRDRYKSNAEICQKTAIDLVEGRSSKESKWLLDKIRNSVKRGLFYWATESEILNDVANGDKGLISNLAIDPTRQTLSEEVQLDYINNIRGFKIQKHFGDLRMANDGSMIVKGKVSGARSKSFDYEIENYLGIGKVTFSTGGHQNNVEEEVIKYLHECVNYTRYNDDEKKFFFLLDGDYWSDKIMNQLRRFQNERVKVYSSDDFYLF